MCAACIGHRCSAACMPWTDTKYSSFYCVCVNCVSCSLYNCIVHKWCTYMVWCGVVWCMCGIYVALASPRIYMLC